MTKKEIDKQMIKGLQEAVNKASILGGNNVLLF